MAFGDIVFNEGEGQNFILEMTRGSIGVLQDILFDDSTNAELPLFEIPQVTGGTGGGPVNIAY